MTSPTLLLQTALEIAQGSGGSDDLPLVAALLRKVAGSFAAYDQTSKASKASEASEAPEPPQALPPAASSSSPAAPAKRAYVRKVPAKRRPKGVASIAEMMQQLEITPSHSDSVRYGTRVAALYRRHTSIPAPKIGAVKMYPAEWLKDTLALVAGPEGGAAS